MTSWILACENCGARNEVPKDAVNEKCGVVYFDGTCENCEKELKGQQEYWRWLGLPEGPPPEDPIKQG